MNARQIQVGVKGERRALEFYDRKMKTDKNIVSLFDNEVIVRNC